MNARNPKWWMLVGVTCLAFAPAASVQAQPNYLKGETVDKPLGEELPVGDFAEDYQYSTSSQGDFAKRQRVETRVKAYMKKFLSGEEHSDEHVESEEQFNALVRDAQGGNQYAIGAVGDAYRYGHGVEKNEQQALEWYKRAIEYGATEYYSAIGDMYREYEPVQQEQGFFESVRGALTGGDSPATDLPDDDAEALKWYEKGVAEGAWESYLRLGMLYRDGVGGAEKDMEAANRYYRQGMQLKKRYDQKMLLEVEQRARIQAEIEEGLRSPDDRDLKWNQQTQVKPKVSIGGHGCALLPMGSPSTQYSTFYEAYCSGLDDEEKQAAPAEVTVQGLSCEVSAWPANDAGKDFELRCK
jgi:TPR repeat protein